MQTDIDALVTHHESEVAGQHWHWVEMGSGEPIILLHGIPESWFCWHHQIPYLARQFRVLALDLKGYGRSSKADGDYTTPKCASEILQLLDSLGIQRFRLAGHDWGSPIADRICEQAPERVVQYVRACISVHRYDVRNSLHHYYLHRDPEEGARLMRKASAYVGAWFDSSCYAPTRPPQAEIDRVALEFSQPGVADAVGRYFRDMGRTPPMDYKKLTMPILYMHGEYDPRQPIEYVEGIDQVIPGLQAVLLLECGHFVTHERPEEVSKAMLYFFNNLLAPDVSLFERSKARGLPTRPKDAIETKGWAFTGTSGTGS
ncbi:MAG TPA: alpha/beta hydrolase [Bellilinea sp.]|nr:alpha/beta hydrolase [Bellilinea sp.]